MTASLAKGWRQLDGGAVVAVKALSASGGGSGGGSLAAGGGGAQRDGGDSLVAERRWWQRGGTKLRGKKVTHQSTERAVSGKVFFLTNIVQLTFI